MSFSVLVGLLDKALRHLAADARTAAAVSSIRLGMSHAQAIARELTAMLEGSCSSVLCDIKDSLIGS